MDKLIEKRRASETLPSVSSTSSCLSETSPSTSSTSTDSLEKKDYRRILNRMQIMTFKVRSLEEKVERIVTEAGLNQNGPAARGVAFTVRLKENTTVNSMETIIFDDVITNIGKAYNTVTGLFKVPFSGRYLFSLTVRAQDNKHVSVEILAEQEVIGQLVAGDNEHETSSASVTVVASLQAADEVYVRETKPWTGYFFGEGYTTFTGISL